MKELLRGVLATLTPEKELLVVNEQEDGWPPELVLMLWRREKFHTLAKNHNPIPQSPSQQSYPGSQGRGVVAHSWQLYLLWE